MGSDSIWPETRSRFVSGARRPYRRRSALKNSRWKSMRVTCSVMSHRSLFILSAITHAFYDPWAIVFLYTWRSTPMEDTRSAPTNCDTQTHTSRPKVWQRAWVRVSTDMWWQTQEGRCIPHQRRGRHAVWNIYLPAVSETARGGRYLRRQGHRKGGAEGGGSE